MLCGESIRSERSFWLLFPRSIRFCKISRFVVSVYYFQNDSRITNYSSRKHSYSEFSAICITSLAKSDNGSEQNYL